MFPNEEFDFYYRMTNHTIPRVNIPLNRAPSIVEFGCKMIGRRNKAGRHHW